MTDEICICVCCNDEAHILFKPRDNKQGIALCLKHAKVFQQIIDHGGNYPVCNVEVMTT